MQPLRMDDARPSPISQSRGSQSARSYGAMKMPKYQMYFDTLRGETRYNVDIDEDETLTDVLEEILFDLRERGDVLTGDGEPQVISNGQSLDFSLPLFQQGVRPNDVLRISTIATNG
jgi:hypothetical protein